MHLLVLATDGLILRNVGRLGTTMDVEVVEATSLDDAASNSSRPAGDPAAVVVDLEEEYGLDTVGESKERWPEAMVIGVVTMPGGDVWKRAELAGCDLVTTRGALARTVPPRLAAWIEDPGGRRLHLFAMNDVAGRLGLVHRFENAELGTFAAYHVGGRVCVVEDVCPHAGARLSEGDIDVDAGVVTCPEHGSRFDTCSGDRLRGPSDEGLRTLPVVVEDGQVYVRLA